MVLSTSELRREWAPACKTKGPAFLVAYQALDECFHAFGYRPRSGVTGAFNCRSITGGRAYSLHAYGPGLSFTFWTLLRIATSLAVDVNWDKNPYGPRLVTDMPRAMIDAIYRVRTRSGVRVFGWGGYYARNKDAMHFEIVCSPADLASGIDPATLPGAVPTPTPTPPALPVDEEDDQMNLPGVIVKGADKAAWFVTDGVTKQWINGREHAALLISQGAAKAEAGGGGQTSEELAAIKPYVWPQKGLDSIRLVGTPPA